MPRFFLFLFHEYVLPALCILSTFKMLDFFNIREQALVLIGVFSISVFFFRLFDNSTPYYTFNDKQD